MSALFRQTRLPRSLNLSSRAPSRCRYSTSAAAQPRHDRPRPHDDPSGDPSSCHLPPDHPSEGTPVPPERPLRPRDDADAPEAPSRVQDFLAAILTAGQKPTVEELARYRPATRPPLHSPAYVAQYRELVDTLDRSFTKEQLRGFLAEALGPGTKHTGSRRKKVQYAESILEQLWQWPTLGDLEKARRDRTEVVTKREFCRRAAPARTFADGRATYRQSSPSPRASSFCS